MYSKDEQRIMINSTLNIQTAEDAANVDRYNNLNGKPIIEESKNFFAKGHLSPDAAFIYQLEQYATYYYINAAPQFQSFNGGNWKQLESATREVAERYFDLVFMLICNNQ